MRGPSGLCLVFAFCFAAIGCSAEADPPKGSTVKPGGDEDSGTSSCIDNDGDGYGRNCSKGRDCDDEDPSIKDCGVCRNNAVIKDCPCKPGTVAQRCVPPTIRVDGGVLVCAEGTRYCRDSYWGDCETIGEYVFQKD